MPDQERIETPRCFGREAERLHKSSQHAFNVMFASLDSRVLHRHGHRLQVCLELVRRGSMWGAQQHWLHIVYLSARTCFIHRSCLEQPMQK